MTKYFWRGLQCKIQTRIYPLYGDWVKIEVQDNPSYTVIVQRSELTEFSETWTVEQILQREG